MFCCVLCTSGVMLDSLCWCVLLPPFGHFLGAGLVSVFSLAQVLVQKRFDLPPSLNFFLLFVCDSTKVSVQLVLQRLNFFLLFVCDSIKVSVQLVLQQLNVRRILEIFHDCTTTPYLLWHCISFFPSSPLSLWIKTFQVTKYDGGRKKSMPCKKMYLVREKKLCRPGATTTSGGIQSSPDCSCWAS